MARSASSSLDIGDILGTTFNVWAKNFVPFALISLVIYSPVILATALTHKEAGDPAGTTSQALIGMLQTALGFVATGAFTFGVVQSLRGKTVAPGECLSTGFARLLPVLGVSLLVGLIVFGGLLLLLIPGIIFACMYTAAVPVAVVEKPGVMASLARSKELTSGFKWTIFGAFIVFVLLSWIIGFVAGLGLATLGLLGAVLIQVVVLLVAGSLNSIMPAVIYQRLRQIKDGVSVEDLGKVFD